MAHRIVFLPIWGKQNETIPQRQMEAVRKLGGIASYGVPGTFFPLTRSAIAIRPEVISLDWIHQYALSPGILASLVKSFAFALDVLLVRFLFGIKLVWTIHNLRHHDPRPRAIELAISRFFASMCIKIRVLGEGVEQTVCNRFKVRASKVVVYPEGSYSDWYPSGITPEVARQKLGIEPEARVWLYLGNLRPYKGVEELLASFRKIAGENTRLVIAGNPWNREYSNTIARLADHDPRILLRMEIVPDAELQVYYSAADLVVLPFKNVFNSGTVLLAMSFAKPVIAPAMGVVPFRLRKQPDLLYQNNDLEAALVRSEKLNQAQLSSLGAANKAFADQYTWTDFATFLLNL